MAVEMIPAATAFLLTLGLTLLARFLLLPSELCPW